MGKLGVTGTALGVGGTGAAGVYGAHKMGWFGGAGYVLDNLEKKHGELYIARDKERFKDNKGGLCLKHSFSGEWSEVKDLKEVGNKSEIALDTDAKASVGGCVAFNWNKEKKDKGWVGSNFRFVWSLFKGNTGFAVYMTGTVQENKDIRFDGFAYWFGKEAGDKWEAKKRLGIVGGSKTIVAGELKDKFPQMGDKLKDSEANGAKPKYWSFLDDDGGEVKEGGESNQAWWQWGSKEDGDEIGLWSPNLNEWWKYFFDESKWNMSELVKGIKGSWN